MSLHKLGAIVLLLLLFTATVLAQPTPSPPITGRNSIQMIIGGTQKVLLSITPPSTYTNGAPIPPGTDCAIVVYYSKFKDRGAPGTYTHEAGRARGKVPGPSDARPWLKITALVPRETKPTGTIYMACKAIVDGQESALNNEWLTADWAPMTFNVRQWPREVPTPADAPTGPSEVPMPPRTGRHSIQMIIGGTQKVLLSIFAPIIYTNGNLIPEGTACTIVVYYSKFKDAGAPGTYTHEAGRKTGHVPRRGDLRPWIDITALVPRETEPTGTIYMACKAIVKGVESELNNQWLTADWAPMTFTVREWPPSGPASTGLGGLGTPSLPGTRVTVGPGARTPGAPASADMDLVFVIDSTGSMGPYINEVKKRVVQLLNEFRAGLAEGGTLHVSCVTYKDKDYDGAGYVKGKSFETDYAALEEWLGGVRAAGGGDTPEDVYDGLLMAIDRTGGLEPWRLGVRKIIILIGDAPPKDRSKKGTTLALVAKRAYEVDPADIHTIATTEKDETTLAFKKIAEKCRGSFHSITDAAELPKTIRTTLDAAVATPEPADTSIDDILPEPRMGPVGYGGGGGGGVSRTGPSAGLIAALVAMYLLVIVLAIGVVVVALRRSRPAPAALAAGELVLFRSGQSFPHPITGPQTVLGRAPQCQVQLDAPRASSVHARVYPQGGQFVLEDLGSTNGTFLNGAQIAGPTVLRPNDRIKIGDAEMVFRAGT